MKYALAVCLLILFVSNNTTAQTVDNKDVNKLVSSFDSAMQSKKAYNIYWQSNGEAHVAPHVGRTAIDSSMLIILNDKIFYAGSPSFAMPAKKDIESFSMVKDEVSATQIKTIVYIKTKQNE